METFRYHRNMKLGGPEPAEKKIFAQFSRSNIITNQGCGKLKENVALQENR